MYIIASQVSKSQKVEDESGFPFETFPNKKGGNVRIKKCIPRKRMPRLHTGFMTFSLQKPCHGHFNPSLQNEVGPRVPSFLEEIGNFLRELKLYLRDSSNRLFLKQKYTRVCNSVVLTTAIKIDQRQYLA